MPEICPRKFVDISLGLNGDPLPLSMTKEDKLRLRIFDTTGLRQELDIVHKLGTCSFDEIRQVFYKHDAN